mmetsp:Transcript_81921/g.187492  ORF Transcript_81921/g.187492 Transcript_81921/m.187492 type:complete len:263 (-) Transcript_81921:309-1097(-)
MRSFSLPSDVVTRPSATQVPWMVPPSGLKDITRWLSTVTSTPALGSASAVPHRTPSRDTHRLGPSTAKELPKRPIPRMESDAPSDTMPWPLRLRPRRAKLRTDSELPRMVASPTEKGTELPSSRLLLVVNWVANTGPATETIDPRRATDLTARASPSLAGPTADRPPPKVPKLATDRQLPRREKLRTDRVDPREAKCSTASAPPHRKEHTLNTSAARVPVTLTPPKVADPAADKVLPSTTESITDSCPPRAVWPATDSPPSA